MATILVLSEHDVRRFLPMAECIEVMAEALAEVARGNAVLPLRTVAWLPDRRGALATMPALLPGIGALGAKVITVFPGNVGSELDSHQGAVLLFEPERGRLLAILDASTVTAIRTAAVSAVATRVLARGDADDLAILGSGVQARTHLEAILAVRPVRRVRVWSRTPERARRFAEDSAAAGVAVEVAASAEAAVAGASIVCTTTAATEPVLRGAWLAPGAHVNAVGSSVPAARELDSDAVARSRLYVDRRESTLSEAGDFLVPRREGRIDDAHIVAELGEVLTGQAGGRGSPDEVTLFKSLGLAVEDVAAARHVYEKALAAGGGTAVELGGGR
ncbi:MAG TPA: ornithine cyclodeaminase family protein [Longimicrobiales bacterium]|nr:ornithine cyclodeaminase family protein [Longimicrobiales bacterium]